MDRNLLDADFDKLSSDFKDTASGVVSESDLLAIKKTWLAKDGVIKDLFSQLKSLSNEEKPQVAAKLNQLKEEIEAFIAQRTEYFKTHANEIKLQSEYLDFSLPALTSGLGGINPVTLVERKMAELIRPFGFKHALGPEVETEYYCFDALNIPKHHPARDMQDTFFTNCNHVLRTHTTSVQARELEKGELPVKLASFGKAYRNESEDASHTSMFHQFEMVWIEEGLTLSHLLGLMSHILKGIYGEKRKLRFVPKYYPYTEPSVGPQIDCVFCKGKGCSACGHSGWATVGGSGMVHSKVLRHFKYDPTKVSGLAFGLGTTRLACQFSGIPHAKMLYENDLRVLKEVA